MTPEKQRAYELKQLTNDTLLTALKLFGSFFFGAGVLASVGILMQGLNMADSGTNAGPLFMTFIAVVLFSAVIFCMCFGLAKILEQNSYLIKERHKDEFSK